MGEGVGEFVGGTRKAESVSGRVCRGPPTPGGLRDGQPTLPTPRAARSPVAPAAHAARGPLVAHAYPTAHAHGGRPALAIRENLPGNVHGSPPLSFRATSAPRTGYTGASVPSLHIVLVEPEIHWNTGNIGRTSLAVGATLHLVEPLGFTLEDRHLRRAGLDYWPRVRLRVWPGWPAFEAELPRLGAPVFLTASAQRTLWDIEFPENVVVVFGRESVGLSSDILARYADRTARIPMVDPGLRSLNISTAVGVVVYEVMRQWRMGEAE